jgi:hypothetical protein
MTSETHEQHAANPTETVLLRSAEAAYAVPLAVLEQHRSSPERRAQIEAALREQGAAELPPAEAPLYELSAEDLAPYRLADTERDEVQGYLSIASVASPIPNYYTWTPGVRSDSWTVWESPANRPNQGGWPSWIRPA